MNFDFKPVDRLSLLPAKAGGYCPCGNKGVYSHKNGRQYQHVPSGKKVYWICRACHARKMKKVMRKRYATPEGRAKMQQSTRDWYTRNRKVLRHIHESNLIEGFDSEEADAQSLEAWKWLLAQPTLKPSVITELQKRIVAHQDDLNDKERGYFRNVTNTVVYVGGKAGAIPQLTPHLVANWTIDYRTMTPKDAHIRFEQIHPFVDGNGRTGRMLMWYQEVKADKSPTLILNSEKQEYYKWFKE